MNLSKDQIRIIKSEAIFVLTFVVCYPLAMLLFGRQLSWSDFFRFAGIMIAVGILLAVFLVVGSKVPTKRDK